MDQALDRAVQWLLEHQDRDGWWCGELETNVTMTAEHVLLLRFLGLELDDIRDGAIRHILGNQRDDGSWALYYDAPADLSTTIEAYVALKVLGLDPQADPMCRALSVILRLGGVAKARVFTKIWLAIFGQYPWAGVPSMPPELVYFPPSLPLNLYDFACWARGTIAPLLIVITLRPHRPLGCDVSEIILPGSAALLRRVPGSGFFWWTDKLLKLYDRLPWHPGRARAMALLVDWIVERQEADGGWGGIQPPWVYSLIALNLQGMGLDHPVMQRGIKGMDGFSLRDDQGFRFQACMSPVWDTAWAMLALRRAGLERDHPSLQRAVRWVLAEQIDRGGDWQVRCGNVPCGGWAFEFQNDIYPDIDDTAVVVLALLEAGNPEEVGEAVRRATDWILVTRSSNGAWGAFDKDNTRQIVYKLPFADFGALLDPPTEDVTAHALEMLAHLPDPAHERVIREGIAYLRDTQRPDGAWFGRWGVNYVYGTWCVIAALAALRDTGYQVREMIERGAAWLLTRQNDDGGWGESCYSYEDPSFAGVGASTPSQTAWAILALQSAGLGRHPACRRGLAYLRDTQVDGTWEERHYTGTGFPRDFYINYHLYRHVFPIMALATAAQMGGDEAPPERQPEKESLPERQAPVLEAHPVANSSTTAEMRLRLTGGLEETVTLTPLGDDRYRLEDTPVTSFINDKVQVFHGDIIQAAPESDGSLSFRAVSARADLQLFNWILPWDVSESAELATYLDAVVAAGGYWERLFGGCLLVYIPRGSEFDPEARLQEVIAQVHARTGVERREDQ